MSTRLVRRLSLLLLAAAPAAAQAFSLSARAGVQYSQVDAWPVEGPAVSMPYLDLDLGLDAKGVIVSRDVVDYRLKASWSRVSIETAGVSSTTRNFLSYAGSAAILQNAVSPVGLSVHAARGESDFATSGTADSFGSGIQTSAGGTVLLRGPGIPTFEAGYNWSNDESQIAGLPRRDSTVHSLNSSIAFGTPAAQLSASYLGEFREGSWDTDDYANHSLTMAALGSIGGKVLSMTAASSFNVPAELVPGTVEQQSTTFSALLNAGSAGNRRNFSYSYGHTLSESPGAPTGEITRQGVRYEGDHFVTGERFFTRWLVDASFAETRSDATVLRTTGETLGVSLWWRRVDQTSRLEINAGPRVGLIQVEGETSGGYGVNGGIRLSRPWGVHTVTADYSAGYAQDLFATAGWQLSQSLGATLTGPAATARYGASLNASSSRTHSPVTGDGAGRQVQASASLAMSRLKVDARAALSNGIVGTAPQQFTSDGLLLPAPFNSTVIDVAAGAALKLLPGLSSHLRVHWGRSDIPGRPVLHELGAVAGASYTYAALGVTLEDRLTRTETDAGWVTVNAFMVSVYRSLSW